MNEKDERKKIMRVVERTKKELDIDLVNFYEQALDIILKADNWSEAHKKIEFKSLVMVEERKNIDALEKLRK